MSQLEDQIKHERILDEALNGVPDFMDVPEALQQLFEQATARSERMFWLRATHIPDEVITRTLLRRAFYAEARAWEMENRLAETSLIASGLKDEVERLQAKLTELAAAT